jgi:hypothetical protein
MAVRSDNTIKTYRYLRLAMVALVVMLAASVVVEWWHTGPRCFQTSISAYYYTPAQAVFVGSLVAVGVCMIVLKGNTEWEDILLNLGGMLAPGVAFVPTPGPGRCSSVPITLRDTPADVANNMTALFVTGAIGLVVAIVLAVVLRGETVEPPNRWHRVGYAVSGLVLAAGVVWFLADRDSFIEGAHYTAAVTLFACIVAVAVLNAWGFGQEHGGDGRVRRYANRYAVIAVAMVLALVGMGLVTWLGDWDHGLLWIEATVIALFAVFWVIQTVELWNEGLREARAV